VTSVGLALEVLDTRLLSVLTWYSLAFFVIAMGLFGLTAGAVHVYLRPEEFTPPELPRRLARAARALALAIPVSFVLLLILPIRAEPVATTLVLFVVFSAVLALPFYPAGIVIAAALTRAPFPIGRVYAVDLLGAALGAPLVPLLLRFLGGGSAILSLSVVAALSSVLFARSGGDRSSARRGGVLAAALLVLSTGNALSQRGLVPLWVKGLPELHDQIELDLWNSHSRVTVSKPGVLPAAFWGHGARCPTPALLQRVLVIDGHAMTPLYLAPVSELGFLSCDVTNVAHFIRPYGPAAIIGVGGSRDIQAALLAGHVPVIGIEFNDRLLDVLRGPLGAPTGIAAHPDVRLVHDEARSFLTRHRFKYQLIQASLIDTWAATGAGAHALGENGLYTRQAFRLFLERLEPGGVLSVSRWSTVETPRLAALAVGALLDFGVSDPRAHVAVMSAGPVTTLIVSRDPLTPSDQTKLEEVARDKGFQVIALPNRPSTAERLARMLEAKNNAALDSVALLDLLDFRPPTDDRPFFFNVIRLRALASELPAVTAGTIEGNLLATRTLGLAFLSSLLLVVVGVALPLARRARPRGRSRASLWAALVYFAAIGIGFMFVEIAILQRLSLLLGQPTYSLIVVLASLVGSAGLGSLLSDRLPLSSKPWCYLFPILIALALLLAAFSWPALAGRIAPAPTQTRIVFAAALSAGLGVLLGLAFPAGMRICRESHAEETPWFWGMNGMGSVLASSAAIMIALEFGLTALLVTAAACYLVLVPAIAIMRGGERKSEELNVQQGTENTN